MEAIKTGWDFFQNEILGMKWLNRLIGSIVEACGLDPASKVGGSIQFFFYDVIKIMVGFVQKINSSETYNKAAKVIKLLMGMVILLIGLYMFWIAF